MDNFRISTAILLSVLMASCGGGASDPDGESGIEAESTAPAQVGAIVDSPIVGLGYNIENVSVSLSLEGFTERGGIFPLIPGSDITFFIGDIQFPTLAAKAVITPLDLFSTTNVNDIEVVNFARLIQTLDSDGDPENGITISSKVNEAAAGMSLDFSSSTFDTDVRTLLIESGVAGGALIDAADALAHLESTLLKLSRFAPGENYFEVYGAMDGSNLFSTSGQALLGTSDSVNSFDVSGYDYFIIYIPPQPQKVFIDQITRIDIDLAPFDVDFGGLHGWDFDVTHPDPDCSIDFVDLRSCFVETESFSGYMSTSLSFLDEFDGLTWESRANSPAYWAEPVRGAEYIVIKRSLPGEFEVNLNFDDYVEPPVAGTIHLSGGPSDLGVFDFKAPETKIRQPQDNSLTSIIALYPLESLPLDLFPGPSTELSVNYLPGSSSPISVGLSLSYQSELFPPNGDVPPVFESYFITCALDDCSGVDYDTVSNVLEFTNFTFPAGADSDSPPPVVLNGSINMGPP